MERKNKEYILHVLNAPPSTIDWIDAMMAEIRESLEDVPDCEVVLDTKPMEAADDKEN